MTMLVGTSEERPAEQQAGRFELDPSGQQPGLWNLYTQLTFCFSMPDALSRPTIVETIRNGLRRLTASFPWIAGQVIREHRGPDLSDHFVISGLDEQPRFVVKRLGTILPTWNAYCQAKFPMRGRYFDENLIAPRSTLPVSHASEPKPVFLLQATFIDKGMLLTFVGQHGTMDMVGQGEIIKLLSKACHQIPFSEEELSLGNRDRRTLVPWLTEAEMEIQDSEIENRTQHGPAPDSETKNGARLEQAEDNIWASFAFSAAALETLKVLAHTTAKSQVTFVSTDDSLSAFIWQSTARARSHRLPYSQTSTLARTVDVRRHLNIMPSYPGNLANKTYTTHTFEELIHMPLGTIAAQLRQSIDIDSSDLAYQTRKQATLLNRPSSRSRPAQRPRDLSRDIALSSWSKLDYCYELDFNLGLGNPIAVRRPAFARLEEQPMEGLVYLLPKAPDGEVVVSMCLRSSDLEILCEAAEWKRYATFIG